MKQSRIGSLKVKNDVCSEEEWELALKVVLLGEESDAEALVGLEAVAAVESETALTVTVRKRIEGITVC